MLRDRYEPRDRFALLPALGMAREPVPAQLATLLDDDTLVQLGKADVAQRRPRTCTDGRPSTPVEVVLRMLVVKPLYGWRYAQTARWVADSPVLRQFRRVYAARVPDDTTRIRWAHRIQPATLHALRDHLVGRARQFTVTRGRKRRRDGTVVETNSPHPTASTSLNDGVRVRSRTRAKATPVVPGTSTLAPAACRDRRRSAKRQMKRSMAAARQRGEHAGRARHGASRRLVELTESVPGQARRGGAAVREHATDRARRVAAPLDRGVPRVAQASARPTRRVLLGAAVPANAQIVSLCEPHTAIIRTGTPGCPTPCGRVRWLDEVEGGVITRDDRLAGKPPEAAQVPPRLAHQRQVVAHPPRVLAGERALHSPANERAAAAHGVAQVVLPKPGAKSAKRIAHEQQRWFRRGHDWRAGIAGRISGLKRRPKRDRCRNHGDAGMERWVGWGLLAHDLRVLAAAIAR